MKCQNFHSVEGMIKTPREMSKLEKAGCILKGLKDTTVANEMKNPLAN